MESNYDDRDTPDRVANHGKRDSSERASDAENRPDRDRRRRQMTDDERVDEASEESFPASDPPAQP